MLVAADGPRESVRCGHTRSPAHTSTSFLVAATKRAQCTDGEPAGFVFFLLNMAEEKEGKNHGLLQMRLVLEFKLLVHLVKLGLVINHGCVKPETRENWV